MYWQVAVASAHLLPAQQGALLVPQARQVPPVLVVLSQTASASLQRLPAQQASPFPPHFTHWAVRLLGLRVHARSGELQVVL
jgi:hypothetical protein